jgi:hypothetical protein
VLLVFGTKFKLCQRFAVKIMGAAFATLTRGMAV